MHCPIFLFCLFNFLLKFSIFVSDILIYIFCKYESDVSDFYFTRYVFSHFDISNLQLRGSTLDFELSCHLSEESGITQQLYIRGGQNYTF